MNLVELEQFSSGFDFFFFLRRPNSIVRVKGCGRSDGVDGAGVGGVGCGV